MTDWTFGGTWPHEPKWFDSADGRMHYVDEGPRDGRPVVMVHGNPTWSYLYRNFIPPLVEAGHRAIALDHLGFGRSDKPGDASLYSIERHIGRCEALLESLDLADAVVVGQDWGGPIGYSWAARHPERVGALFVLNTFAHRIPEPIRLPMPFPLLRAPITGELLVKRMHLFVNLLLLRAAVAHPERLGADEKAAYRAPHPDYDSRTAILVFPREIPTKPDDPVSKLLGPTEDSLREHFRDRPVKICWAMKDPAFTPRMLDELWLQTFPDAEVMRIEDASHFLQEDAHERIVPELVRFASA